MKDEIPPTIIKGIPISSGYATGYIHLHKNLVQTSYSANDMDYSVENEFIRLDSATEKITEDLRCLAIRVGEEIDEKLAEVFGAHSHILNDKLLREELRHEILTNFVSASSAVSSVFLRWERRFMIMESALAKEKCDDFRDIAIRLRNSLAGITTHPYENIPSGCILATQRLLPSETVFLRERSTKAVILEYGMSGSHSALFTRQMGIPCVSGIQDIETLDISKCFTLVDANNGIVIINPTNQHQEQFQHDCNKYHQKLSNIQRRSSDPAITTKGEKISVLANISSHEDTKNAKRNGADGIGLYRLEEFYIGRSSPPDLEELIAELEFTLGPLYGKPICIRLADIGSDKPFPFAGYLNEDNPALGRRGIRLMREYPDLLQTQINAVLYLAQRFKLQLLIPMVTLVDDVKFVKEVLMESALKYNSPNIELGAMIETPAAALAAVELAPYVDFMSIGTNDLTKYIFAADRENPCVQEYYLDHSNIIFELIASIRERLPHMPLSVCGELAGKPEHIKRLLNCGINSVSVSPPMIAEIKDAVRNS